MTRKMTVTEVLCNIRKAWGLDEKTLARLFGADEGQIGRWIERDRIGDDRMSLRAYNLFLAAENWMESANPVPTERELHSTRAAGKTLWESLLERPLDEERIRFLGQSLRLARLGHEKLPDPF